MAAAVNKPSSIIINISYKIYIVRAVHGYITESEERTSNA